MNHIRNVLFFCTALFLYMSCTAEDSRNESLLTAIQMVDNNPKDALQLLEGIPDPEGLDQDSYMQYIVTKTQALYMDDQDITLNMNILKAQSYFSETRNAEMAARASYYTAAYWYEKGVEEKALEYALLAYHFAQQANNNLFSAKAAQWIGSTYYDQEVFDSARDYYLQALELYTNEANTEVNQLDIKYMLGRIYRELHQFDQALNYLNDGLEAAQKLNNQLYEARFTYYKGIIFRERKAYPEAKAYFDQALAKSPDTEDIMRINLNYARLYKATNQPDSTIHYLNLVKSRVAEITYPYTRQAIYQELAVYYKKEGNIEEFDHYSTLQKKEERLIQNMKNDANAQVANERFEAYKQQSEQKYNQSQIISLAIFLVLLVLLTVAVIYGLGKYRRYKWLKKVHLLQKYDFSHFLLGGLQTIAKSMELFSNKKQELSFTAVGDQFYVLRKSINSQIAELAIDLMRQLHKGAKALPRLNEDELCIIFMSQMKYPIESIGWMLGCQVNLDDYVSARKSRICQILTEAGMHKQDIKTLFTPIL